MLEGSYQLGLSDLLDQNLSCYEYFHSLPENVQRRIVQRDVASIEAKPQLAVFLQGFHVRMSKKSLSNSGK